MLIRVDRLGPLVYHAWGSGRAGRSIPTPVSGALKRDMDLLPSPRCGVTLEFRELCVVGG